MMFKALPLRPAVIVLHRVGRRPDHLMTARTGGVLAAKAVGTRSKGSALAAKAVETSTRQKQCLTVMPVLRAAAVAAFIRETSAPA